MTAHRTVGVIGTIVWDRIFGAEGAAGEMEGWGGILYSLAAMSASLDPSWRILAVAKVGADLADDARRAVRDIPGVDDSGLVVVPEPNNRVEIRYLGDDRRTERLAGGVPGWTWDELVHIVGGCDGLYVNFVSGFEMDLETAVRLRDRYHGPTYADLHSLFLGREPDGSRVPRRLASWVSWLSCFDAVQMNEHEFQLIGPPGDPWEHVAALVGPELELVLVTRGSRGAEYLAAAEPRAVRGSVPLSGPVRTGDPTGCGDVWGATMFAQRLQGRDVSAAMSEANRVASLAVDHRGAEHLHLNLAASPHIEESV